MERIWHLVHSISRLSHDGVAYTFSAVISVVRFLGDGEAVVSVDTFYNNHGTCIR